MEWIAEDRSGYCLVRMPEDGWQALCDIAQNLYEKESYPEPTDPARHWRAFWAFMHGIAQAMGKGGDHRVGIEKTVSYTLIVDAGGACTEGNDAISDARHG